MSSFLFVNQKMNNCCRNNCNKGKGKKVIQISPVGIEQDVGEKA